ncbi:MAG: VWA domain-containing protein [Archaeoglobus sp.]|nr:VWA domain-containing protein [Archaeoglobus sp.]
MNCKFSGRKICMESLNGFLEDEKGVSPLLEYLMLVTIASVFVLLLGLYLNSVFADSVTKTVLENQLSDVGAEISAQMVDMYLLYPSDGQFSAKIYMPEKVGDYEIISTFENIGGKPYLVIQSETGEIKKYVGLGNLPLDFSLNGSTHSMQEDKNITYSTENYIYPTAIIIAGPTLIKSGMQVEFDPRFSKTDDGYFEYQIDFGDGNVTPRLVYDDFNDTVLHTYYTSSETNYTATLQIWDRLGYTANDSIRIHVMPNTSTPNPEMFIDKFVSPGYANLGDPVTIHIFMRGEGFRTAPRYLDVVHVIDVSGSMSPDYMDYYFNDRDYGYTPYHTFSGTLGPEVWEDTFEVNQTGSDVVYEVVAYTNDTYGSVNHWYSSSYYDSIQLYVEGPTGSVGNSNGIINSPPMYGKRFTVTNPQIGNWTIKVIGLFPDESPYDRTDLHVRVYRYNLSTQYETGSVTLGWGYDVENYYFNVGSDVSKLTIKTSSNKKYYLRIYNPSGGIVYNGGYSTLHLWSTDDPEDGTWRLRIYKYWGGSRTVNINITKQNQTNTQLIKTWDTDYYSSSQKLEFNLSIPCEDLKITFDSTAVSPTYAWINGLGFTLDPIDISSSQQEVRASDSVDPQGDYKIYIVDGYSESNINYNVETRIGKLDAAKISGLSFNGVLANNDSVGLVEFSSNYNGYFGTHSIAQLDNYLTSDKTMVNGSILALFGAGGTGMGEGIKLAYNELKTNGTPGRIHAIVLLSDGEANIADGWCGGNYYYCDGSSSCVDEAKDYARCWASMAKADNITIYTVALGDAADPNLMEELASGTDYFYPADRADELINAYIQIATELREKAAENITVTDVIPPNVELDPSSIEIKLGSGLVNNFQIIDTPNGTALQWEIPQINISDIWHVSFRVTSNTTGLIGLDVPDVSNVTYTPYPFSSTKIYYLPNETVIYSTGQRASMTLG